MSSKEVMRTDMLQRRLAIPAADLRGASTRIQSAVERLPEWIAARSVCLYLALPGEPYTGRLVHACRQTGRSVLIPVYHAPSGTYRTAYFNEDDRLQRGRLAVLEPMQPRWALSLKVDLALVPGVAFDGRGRRLGRGGGYYDRLLKLPALNGAFKLGLALSAQMVRRVPSAEHDVAMDAVLTEQRLYRPE